MRRTVLILALLAALPCGSMSVVNHSPYFCDEAGRERPYGGVRMGTEAIGGNVRDVARGQVENPRDLFGRTFGTMLFVIDLPLSFIADTMWLPHDIRVTRDKRNRPPAEPVPEPAKSGE
ncbi:MAG TPA: YceK/YidQ family lipoprotein [Gemmata sp.]|nr:YceK/YidQ family lipoprotein [Gemmata sp.]